MTSQAEMSGTRKGHRNNGKLCLSQTATKILQGSRERIMLLTIAGRCSSTSTSFCRTFRLHNCGQVRTGCLKVRPTSDDDAAATAETWARCAASAWVWRPASAGDVPPSSAGCPAEWLRPARPCSGGPTGSGARGSTNPLRCTCLWWPW